MPAWGNKLMFSVSGDIIGHKKKIHNYRERLDFLCRTEWKSVMTRFTELCSISTLRPTSLGVTG